MGLGIFLSMSQTPQVGESKPISEVLEKIDNDEVSRITVEGDTVTAELKDGEAIYSLKETSSFFYEILEQNNVDPSKVTEGIEVVEGFPWGDFLLNIAPIALTAVLFLFIFRQARGGAGDIFSFGRSRAKLFHKGKSPVKFTDVAGLKEAKQELTEIVDFLKNPKKYRALGARIPRGVLLVGPAGVGKTLLARAVAGEANVPFFSVAGSEFMEMLVGVGSSRVRDLFAMAKASQPALIFIDEIDAIGRQRGMGIGGGHDEREQTLNQILVEMDGFDPRTQVIVISATNRPDMLDPALIRPGRFDRRVALDLPDIAEREAIIKIHMKGKPFAKDVKTGRLARRTVGYSGADIENTLNESAILAARANRKSINASDLEEAATKVKLGPERRKLQSDEEKKMVAYHEAGHALVAANLPNMDPVHRISIVARGLSLGHTMFPPTIDRYNETKTRLLEMIATSLGGRAAEEIVFNEETVGAASDIERATQVARAMVTEFGMSDLGPISYRGRENRYFLARQLGDTSQHGEETATKIDEEINKIVEKSYKKAKEIVKEHRTKLNKVAEELIKQETIEGDEFEQIIGKKK